MRVAVKPKLIKWALERAGLEGEDLALRFPKLSDWESGDAAPTLKQLEDFARAVHVPVGYLFLETPPEEVLPIPDFRTVASRRVRRPSPNLLDMIYVCQERQAWYREFAQLTRQPRLDFVGSLTTSMSAVAAAERIRQKLGFSVAARAACPTWTEALRLFIQQADQSGVLVMVSGIVLSNTHRPLDVEEFRGFALADDLAPLVFINGSDTKSAQMFTLAHELAHVWLGATALSDLSIVPQAGYRGEEVWCNQVAAELLVPMQTFQGELRDGEALNLALSRLARRFKVSTLVVLRRMLDAGWLAQPEFDDAWMSELTRLRGISRDSSGGDFFRSTVARVSRRFGRALVENTLEGQTLYRDAFRMLGISKAESFERFGREVGALL